MCGHVGIFGQGIITSDVEAFKDLLFMDQLRGHHATGIADIKRNGVSTVLKRAVPASEFLDLTEVSTLLNSATMSVALMGHNRWATQGGLTEENAHPFQHNHITLAHNGSLYSRYGLSGSITDFDVDSNHIAYTMSLREPADFVPNVQGPYALVWHDARDASINFVRNAARPMYIMKLKTRDVYLYASEVGMLYAAISRRKVVPEVDWVEELPIHTIRKFKLPSTTVAKTETTADVVYTPYVPKTSYDYGDWYKGKQKWKGKDTSTKSTVDTAYDLAQYKKLGISRGDTIEVVFYEFLPWQNGVKGHRFGRLIGYVPSTGADVVVHSVNESEAWKYTEHDSTRLGCITVKATRYVATVAGEDGKNRASEANPWINGDHLSLKFPPSVQEEIDLTDLPTLEDEEMDTLVNGNSNVVEMPSVKKPAGLLVGGHFVTEQVWSDNFLVGCADCYKNLIRSHAQDYLYDPKSQLIYCRTCK